VKRSRRFPRDPESVGHARRFAAQVLADVPRALFESIELMVSELTTNSIRHGRAGFELTITNTAQMVRVEVTDRAGGTPRKLSPPPEQPTGRGLKIVDLLSDTWGVDWAEGSGKTVWLTVSR
jgi:anti-sigma regulatory factor (Ser/Thr protein kinase)